MIQTKETKLDKIRSRPRFKIYTPLSKTDYIKKLKQYLEENSKDFYGNINAEVAEISVRTPQENYWKPRLALRIEEEGKNTVIRGVFGPSSFFVFLYFTWSMGVIVFGTMVLVEKQIGSNEFPWALSVAILSLILLGLTYLASLIGQAKAKEEMKKLREFAVKANS